MRLGIMQPYFFPYLEHFRLMASCDRWVVFDTVEYRRKTWMNRNRILNRDKGWAYITAPVVKAPHTTQVSDVALANHIPWRSRLMDQVRVYERRAPHFDETVSLINSVVAADHEQLVGLNVAALNAVSGSLDVATEIVRLTDLDLELPANCGPGEWALFIAKEMGATEYRNPAGGRDLFDPSQFAAHDIHLSFHQPLNARYPTPGFEFVPDLSIIDVLMWVDGPQLRSWMQPGAPNSGPMDQ